MLNEIQRLLLSAITSLWIALQLLALSAVYFVAIALLVKGNEAIAAARRAVKEIRLNLSLYFFDALLVAPAIALIVAFIRALIGAHTVVAESWWSMFPRAVVFVAVLFIGDFISYWRHRLEHTRWLWPAHAIHHSDTEMSWITLARFHPVNRVTTMAVDIGCLAWAGFPEWALIANVMLRYYYGEFIHADLPWTYGPLQRLFVSPVMHRWHHAREGTGAGSNFATVFSVFDQVFRTYYVPGLCNVPLGVRDEIGPGLIGQLVYPFKAWVSTLRHKLITAPLADPQGMAPRPVHLANAGHSEYEQHTTPR